MKVFGISTDWRINMIFIVLIIAIASVLIVEEICTCIKEIKSKQYLKEFTKETKIDKED